MKREQAIVREIASMISIVACCHSAKLCAHAARDFLVCDFSFYSTSSFNLTSNRRAWRWADI